MAAKSRVASRQRPVACPAAPKPGLGRGKPPTRLKWAVDGRSLVRLRAEWAGLSPEFREAVRLQALTRGKYLLEVLEAKGLAHNVKRAILGMEETK